MNKGKWNSKVLFPTDSNFAVRFTNVKFSPSKSSGNPMFTIESEIVYPDNAEVGEDTYVIAGVNPNPLYLTTQRKNQDGSIDEEGTEQARGYVKELYQKLELSVEGIDWDNIDTSKLKGIIALCQISPEIQEQRKNPTALQIAEAKKLNKRPEGDVMKNPITGKPLIYYKPIIREIFGLAPADLTANKPY